MVFHSMLHVPLWWQLSHYRELASLFASLHPFLEVSFIWLTIASPDLKQEHFNLTDIKQIHEVETTWQPPIAFKIQ